MLVFLLFGEQFLLCYMFLCYDLICYLSMSCDSSKSREHIHCIITAFSLFSLFFLFIYNTAICQSSSLLVPNLVPIYELWEKRIKFLFSFDLIFLKFSNLLCRVFSPVTHKKLVLSKYLSFSKDARNIQNMLQITSA